MTMRAKGGGRLTKLLVGGTVAAAMTLSSTGVASAHFLGYDSVDGGEIRYDEATKYNSELSNALYQWNAVGSVDFKVDTWWTYEDVHLNDTSRSDVSWVGLYSNRSGTDQIYFNAYYLDGYTWCRRTKTVIHEMGHALGLDHSYWPNLMAQGDVGSCTLQSHDKSDYHALWG